MKTTIKIVVIAFGILISTLSCSGLDEQNGKISNSCECDTTKVKKLILSNEYLTNKYDMVSFDPDSLYSLSAKENRLLWFRDIESPDTTKFTKFWNDYLPTNYHADNTDFIQFYEGKNDVEFAFQFGPGGMMWTFHSFVIKKIECCYLITRSTFTHARFRYKAYAFLTNSDIEKLRKTFKPYEHIAIPAKEEYGYHGHFVDNRNKRKFFIDFEKLVDSKNKPTKEILKVYNFVDDSIRWNKTY